MKSHLSSLLILALVFIAACDPDGIGPRISGSGNVVTEARTLDAFDRIQVDGSTNIVLRQEATQVVSVEGDDNIVPIISTQVRNGELLIDNRQSYRTKNPVTVYIAIPTISGLRIRGSSDLIGTTALEGEALTIEVSGSGNVDVELYYEELTTSITGSSDITLAGEVTKQNVSVTGSGNYRARELSSEECLINVTGSGDGVVRVSQLLDAKVTGSGDVLYYGNPEVRSSVTGSGDLAKG